jgi:hypothetical protein
MLVVLDNQVRAAGVRGAWPGAFMAAAEKPPGEWAAGG